MKQVQALKRKTGRSNIIGQRLKLARSLHNPPLTMDTLSEMLEDQADLHMSAGTIGKIEVGIRSVYDYEITAFASILGVTTDWLLNTITLDV